MTQKKNKRDRKSPGAYRPEAGAQIARIEAKRQRLGLSRAELAGRAGMTERTLANVVRDRRAFGRTLRALTFALRSAEREQAAGDDSFGEGA